MNTLILYKNCAMNLYGIKRRTKFFYHKSVQEGGLGLPHLKTFISALKITGIRKFINTNHKWGKYSTGEISIH